MSSIVSFAPNVIIRSVGRTVGTRYITEWFEYFSYSGEFIFSCSNYRSRRDGRQRRRHQNVEERFLEFTISQNLNALLQIALQDPTVFWST